MLPNLYIPIPKGMRLSLFKCEDIYTGEVVTHYITGGRALIQIGMLQTEQSLLGIVILRLLMKWQQTLV